MIAGQTVLAVFAHPDDESLACGGTIARLADAGARVIVVCASHGERGSHAGPVRDDSLGRTRAGEVRAAAQTLGVAELILLNHPDGDLRWCEVPELHAELVMLMRHHAPAAVITFGEDGLYWHVDHIAIHERTTDAVRALGDEAPPLYYVTMPLGVMPQIVNSAKALGWTPPPKGFWSLEPNAFGLHAAQPTIVVDVADWVPRKIAALLSHESQMVEGHPFARINAQDARRWLGVEHFHRALTPSSRNALLEGLCT
ncbi:MAG TPA: PIG-L deacetylase family protein [Vicinamibacterales bacterium]|jgi:LmbE family N-acetylglucosaminyl deacetylase